MNSRGRHVRNIQLQIVEVMINTRRPTADVAIAEISRDAGDGEQLHLMTGRERLEIVLESRQIDLGIGRNVLRSAGCKNRLSLNVIGSWQVLRHEPVLKR